MSSLGFDLTVTGVAKKLPENTHFTFDKIISTDLFVDMGARDINDWNSGRCYNYIELKKGIESKVIDEKIRHILKKFQENSNSEISIQNIKKIHLYSSRKYIRCQRTGRYNVCKDYGDYCFLS
jgi:putative ABC transport system permease protein